MYAKLFSSLFDGSLATRGPWQALVVFQNLLVLADRFGIVDKTPDAISRITTLPLDMVQLGLAELEKPDPDSRRPDHEGRRIIRLDPDRSWGWQIVNHAHYRAIRRAEDRRDYQRQYMQEWRSGKRRKAAPKGNGEDKPAAVVLPDWIAPEPWARWIKIRPAKARTPDALQAVIAKLDKMRAEGHDANAVIANSLANGWQGLFPPDAKRGAAVAPANRPAITCSVCGQRAYTWTADKCDACYRTYMGAQK